MYLHLYNFVMNIFLRLLSLSILIGLLTGCTFPTNPVLPTMMPTEYIPTAIALTLEAKGVIPRDERDAAGTPTITQLPQEVEPSETPHLSTTNPPTPTTTPESESLATSTGMPAASLTPDVTITLTPDEELPYGRIQILSPGPASRVASPFLFRAFLAAGPTGRAQIELLGEDGRLLMREIKKIGANEGAQLYIAAEMNFEISAAAETGRVVVSIEDTYGRTMSLASTDVILLSLGESDINQPGDLKEKIIIKEPKVNALIQGGEVHVSGMAQPVSDKPLVIELQTTDGRIVGISHMVHVVEAEVGSRGEFAVDVPYSIEDSIRVRLVVWERGDRIPGVVHLSSLEVMLSP